jgi:hypothetical protein
MSKGAVNKILGEGGPYRRPCPFELTDPDYAFKYAYQVTGGPFPEGEAVISTSGIDSFVYALLVLKAPFPAGEPAILRSEDHRPRYIEFLKQLGIDPDEYFAERIASGDLTVEEVYGT